MTNRRTDEYKTQYRITKYLNKIVTTADKKKRRELKNELYDLTNHFWYRKFSIIRSTLQGRAQAKTKCDRIQEVIDTPKEGLSTLL
ncbi:MAG: hypothetical protein ACYS1A_00800 [Planctomycetota bacterium]